MQPQATLEVRSGEVAAERPAPLRVLHVFGCMDRGGAEMRTLELLRSLDPLACRFDFCTLMEKAGELDGEIRSLGGEVHPVGLGPAFPGRFLDLLRDRRYSVVHSHVHYFSGAILALAAWAGAPRRIAHFRTTEDGKGVSAWRRARNAALRFCIGRYATDIVGVSRAALAGGWGENWRDDPRCQVIYSGTAGCAERAVDGRDSVRSELGLPTDTPLLLHVGRMTPEKNHEWLLRMFAVLLKSMPDARLLLAGKQLEPVFASVQALIRELGLGQNVLPLGVRSDVQRLLSAADLAVSPSLREGLPGAVIEAGGAGTPVLASDIGPMLEVAEYLPIRTMSLNEPLEAWAAAAVELCRDRAMRDRMAAAFAGSPFTMGRSVAAFQRLYGLPEAPLYSVA